MTTVTITSEQLRDLVVTAQANNLRLALDEKDRIMALPAPTGWLRRFRWIDALLGDYRDDLNGQRMCAAGRRITRLETFAKLADLGAPVNLDADDLRWLRDWAERTEWVY